jgi:hypothetical protein
MCNGKGTKFDFNFFVKMIGIEDFRKIQKIDFKIGLEVPLKTKERLELGSKVTCEIKNQSTIV